MSNILVRPITTPRGRSRFAVINQGNGKSIICRTRPAADKIAAQWHERSAAAAAKRARKKEAACSPSS